MKTFVLILSLYMSMTSEAQTYSDDPVEFETASVKLSKECLYDTSIGAGGVALKGVPLKPILAHAFNIMADRISGLSWRIASNCARIWKAGWARSTHW
jgi:hypothetical protein